MGKGLSLNCKGEAAYPGQVSSSAKRFQVRSQIQNVFQLSPGLSEDEHRTQEMGEFRRISHDHITAAVTFYPNGKVPLIKRYLQGTVVFSRSS